MKITEAAAAVALFSFMLQGSLITNRTEGCEDEDGTGSFSSMFEIFTSFSLNGNNCDAKYGQSVKERVTLLF